MKTLLYVNNTVIEIDANGNRELKELSSPTSVAKALNYLHTVNPKKWTDRNASDANTSHFFMKTKRGWVKSFSWLQEARCQKII